MSSPAAPVRAVAVDVGALGLGPEHVDALLRCWSAAERPPVIWLLQGASPSVEAALGADQLRFPLLQMGLAGPDPHVLEMAAALAGCRVRDLLVITAPASVAAQAATSIRARLVEVTDLAVLASTVASALSSGDGGQGSGGPAVGVGPHPEPWPDDDRLDPELLRLGDRRNVVDRYRYWSEAAIVADLAQGQLPVHVAVENWQHDLNIGTVVRNANAFGVAGVHIVGARRWNRRGAMATDRYLQVHHHPTVLDLVEWARSEQLALVGIDNVPGSVPIETASLPDRAVLVFGQEGPGLSAEMAAACAPVCSITQYGSTRSLNVGVASGIALYVWARQHR